VKTCLPGQILHKRLTDLTTGTSHQNSFFAHMVLLKFLISNGWGLHGPGK